MANFYDLPQATRFTIQKLIAKRFSSVFRVEENGDIVHVTGNYTHGYLVVTQPFPKSRPQEYRWEIVDSSGDRDELVASGTVTS